MQFLPHKTSVNSFEHYFRWLFEPFDLVQHVFNQSFTREQTTKIQYHKVLSHSSVSV